MKALLARLEPLNVTPLVEHRVVRVLLSDPAAIGMQIVTGKCKPVQATLRQMGSGVQQSSRAADLPTVAVCRGGHPHAHMVRGHLGVGGAEAWYLASGTRQEVSLASKHPQAADTIDWWGDLVQPLLLKKHGATFLSSLAPLATPADFFSDERRLRLGTQTCWSSSI